MPRLIDLSHAVEHGMVTYKGLPAPIICDFLSREDSKRIYAPGTEFHIGKIEMVANTGTYLDAPFHRYADGKDLSELPLESVADLDAVVVRAPVESGRAIGPGRRGPSGQPQRSLRVRSPSRPRPWGRRARPVCGFRRCRPRGSAAAGTQRPRHRLRRPAGTPGSLRSSVAPVGRGDGRARAGSWRDRPGRRCRPTRCHRGWRTSMTTRAGSSSR